MTASTNDLFYGKEKRALRFSFLSVFVCFFSPMGMEVNSMVSQSAPSALGKKNTPLARAARILKKEYELWILILPVIAYFIIFCYIPMYGLVIAFQDYMPGHGFLDGPWVGLKHFSAFIHGLYSWRLVRNTVLLNVFLLLWGFPVPIIFALILNEVKVLWFKKLVQTVSYLPYFISTVVICGLIKSFLSPADGIVNILRESIGLKSINFLSKAKYFRSVYVVTDIWVFMGWNSIIYIAAISGINQEMYEAARIDGASRIQSVRYITLPSIKPTIILLLIMNIGSLMSMSAEKILLLYSPLTYETADVISTYVYRSGLLNAQYSFASATGLFNSVINFLLLVFANWLSKKYTEVSLW